MTPANDALAKKRYFAIVAMRLAGALLVLIGAFDFAVMPRLLARRWRSPKNP